MFYVCVFMFWFLLLYLVVKVLVCRLSFFR